MARVDLDGLEPIGGRSPEKDSGIAEEAKDLPVRLRQGGGADRLLPCVVWQGLVNGLPATREHSVGPRVFRLVLAWAGDGTRWKLIVEEHAGTSSMGEPRWEAHSGGLHGMTIVMEQVIKDLIPHLQAPVTIEGMGAR